MKKTALVLAMIAGFIGISATDADAHGPRASVRVTQVCTYAGEDWTNIAFAARKGNEWLMDDGTAQLQVWDASGRTRGWMTFRQFGDDGIPSKDDLLVSGGEGHLRWNGVEFSQQGGHAVKFRVLYKGGVSRAVPVYAHFNCED